MSNSGIEVDERPLCENESSFEAGWGDCYTYFNYHDNNFNYCSEDYDVSLGLYAFQSCSQCGDCQRSVSLMCLHRQDFRNMRGEDCSTYALGSQNHLFCAVDYDSN